LRLEKEQLLVAAREESQRDSDWIITEAARGFDRELKTVQLKIAAQEAAKKTQNVAIQQLKDLSLCMRQNVQQQKKLVGAISKKENQLEFVLRQFFLAKGMQNKMTKLKAAFADEYNEPYVDTVTSDLIDFVAEQIFGGTQVPPKSD
jgi:hypothetical protein